MSDKIPTYLEWFTKTKSTKVKLLTVLAFILPLLASIFIAPILNTIVQKSIMFIAVFWWGSYIVYKPLKQFRDLLYNGWFDRNDYKTNKKWS